MNKILSTLVLAAALSSTAAFAKDDTFRVSMENGKQRVDFSLNGNDKITCQPASKTPDRVASSESN